jgi:hypothetical protein
MNNKMPKNKGENILKYNAFVPFVVPVKRNE